MILELNLKTNILIYLLITCCVSAAFADPVVGGELLPPAEAKYVTDPEILRKLNIDSPTEPVWCYSNLANSLLISSADREREKCTLKTNQRIEELTIRHNFQLNTLRIELDSERQTSEKIIQTKNEEIKKLTDAALKRPNDYTFWWVTGGFTAGALTTIGIFFLAK